MDDTFFQQQVELIRHTLAEIPERIVAFCREWTAEQERNSDYPDAPAVRDHRRAADLRAVGRGLGERIEAGKEVTV